VRKEFALAVGYVTAGLGPLAAMSVLSPLRAQPLSTGVVVLVLVAMIVAAAVLAGPVAAAAATLSAAASFDFLFVPPYRELKLGPVEELWPAALLIAFGLWIVVVVRGTWTGEKDELVSAPPPRQNSSRHVQRIALLIEQGADGRDIVAAVQAELTALLLVRSCRFDLGHDIGTRPRIERDGTVTGHGSEPSLPATELDIPVCRGNQRVGRFVVVPTPGAVVPMDHRIVAVILTDHLAACLATGKPTAPPRT
jgi:K+-sensing histidine kinase KdpD